jgi:hypothetical protein
MVDRPGGLSGASLQHHIRSGQVAGERGHERSRSLEYVTQYEYPRTERSNNNGILVCAPCRKYARRASFYMIDVLARQRTSIRLSSSSAGNSDDDDDGTTNANVHRPRPISGSRVPRPSATSHLPYHRLLPPQPR